MTKKQIRKLVRYFFIGSSVAAFMYTCTTNKPKSATTPQPPKENARVNERKSTKDSVNRIKSLKQLYNLSTTDSIVTVSINLVGDLMCHKPQMNNAKKSDSTYDFNPSFAYIKPYLTNADYTIGNLETTFAGPKVPFAGYPAFNSPDAFAAALKNTGFDMLVTANNHSMDTQEKGLLRTLKIIKQNDMAYTGTYSSESDKNEIRMVDLNSCKLAILNYTYGTNGAYPSKKHNYMLNVIDSGTIFNQVALSKQSGADVVLVFFHFGVENEREATKAQKKAVEWARKAGALLIIGAHPHVVGTSFFSTLDTPGKDSCLIAYSLGNFISNQYWRYTDAGIILSVEIKKNLLKNKVKIGKVEYLPTWVYRGQNPKYKQHVVLPAALAMQPDSLLPDFINEELKMKMQQAFEDTKEIISRNNAKLHLKNP